MPHHQPDTQDLDTRHRDIRERTAAHKRDGLARHYDIAAQLGISEGALVAAHLTEGAVRATRLRLEWPGILAALGSLGEVMALTRNQACVHEKIGTYRNISHNGHVGLVLGGAIDLRVFCKRWAHGFAMVEQTDRGVQQSLQFFDQGGVAIHKIFLRPDSNRQAYEALVARFRHASQQAGLPPAIPSADAELAQPDTAIDVVGLLDCWSGLQDTHDFVGLLKRFGVTRTQALRLAAGRFTRQVPPSSARDLIERAARTAVPIMVFVSNGGIIQIHSGVVCKIVSLGPWLNILDPDFNLHLREACIHDAWIVKKPTADGPVTSLELFDRQGGTIAQFFGARKPGTPERDDWRDLIETLIGTPEPCIA